MDKKRIIFLDATPESKALQFKENPLFSLWLHCFNNISDGLKFIDQNPLSRGTDVYLARDNIYDNVSSESNASSMRPLLKLLEDLPAIRHVIIFSPPPIDDNEVEINTILDQSRVLDDVISIDNLQCHMCTKGIGYLQRLIEHHTKTEAVHLTENVMQNIIDLRKHLETLIDEQRQRLDPIQTEHSNKPGEQPS